jgi:hypothetical protein
MIHDANHRQAIWAGFTCGYQVEGGMGAAGCPLDLPEQDVPATREDARGALDWPARRQTGSFFNETMGFHLEFETSAAGNGSSRLENRPDRGENGSAAPGKRSSRKRNGATAPGNESFPSGNRSFSTAAGSKVSNSASHSGQACIRGAKFQKHAGLEADLRVLGARSTKEQGNQRDDSTADGSRWTQI